MNFLLDKEYLFSIEKEIGIFGIAKNAVEFFIQVLE